MQNPVQKNPLQVFHTKSLQSRSKDPLNMATKFVLSSVRVICILDLFSAVICGKERDQMPIQQLVAYLWLILRNLFKCLAAVCPSGCYTLPWSHHTQRKFPPSLVSMNSGNLSYFNDKIRAHSSRSRRKVINFRFETAESFLLHFSSSRRGEFSLQRKIAARHVLYTGQSIIGAAPGLRWCRVSFICK